MPHVKTWLFHPKSRIAVWWVNIAINHAAFLGWDFWITLTDFDCLINAEKTSNKTRQTVCELLDKERSCRRVNPANIVTLVFVSRTELPVSRSWQAVLSTHVAVSNCAKLPVADGMVPQSGRAAFLTAPLHCVCMSSGEVINLWYSRHQ